MGRISESHGVCKQTMVPLLAARLTWTISYIEKLGRSAILKRVKLSINYQVFDNIL